MLRVGSAASRRDRLLFTPAPGYQIYVYIYRIEYAIALHVSAKFGSSAMLCAYLSACKNSYRDSDLPNRSARATKSTKILKRVRG